ncbi:P2Y purinoceptor 13-like isoform X2 [Takifugu rubripes]|uniref:P2Y purinoceptor 13-like isoform X2 n=1 Tax=Takifugu rubripes TaxID=31033 RepID=UPI001145E430|nr:P2Y purinoceptor 13-like isoform X2 [Takifugu rubripes]
MKPVAPVQKNITILINLLCGENCVKKLWREERAPQRRQPAQARETEGLEDWHRVGQTTVGQQEQEERAEGRKEGGKEGGLFTQRKPGNFTGIVTRHSHNSSRSQSQLKAEEKMNRTVSNASVKCVRDAGLAAVIFPCLYSVLFVVALILNSLAAWVFFKIPNSSTFVVFLKNVVVADMLMTLTIPVRVISDAGMGSWQLRAFHCRYSAVLFYMTMYISILLMGAISLDRYLKIVRPFGKCALQQVRVGQILSGAIWVVMLSLALPNVLLSNQPMQAHNDKCTAMKSAAGMAWHEGFSYFCQVIFWGTLALMTVCYTLISKKVYESYKSSKSSSQAASRKTKAKVFIVLAVFSVCFAPYHFTRVPYTLSQTGSMVSDCWTQNALYVTKKTTLWLSAANVCLDPLIYVFLCGMFRKRLAAALCRRSVPSSATESRVETCSQVEMSQMVQSVGDPPEAVCKTV